MHNHFLRIIIFALAIFFAVISFVYPVSAAPQFGADVALKGGNEDEAGEVEIETPTPEKDEPVATPTLVDCNPGNLQYVANYYKHDKELFACTATGKIGEKEILAQYKDSDGIVKQTRVFTTAKLTTEDIAIDISNGQLVVSGVLTNGSDAWNTIYSSFKTIIVGVTGIGFLICVLAFVFQFIRLGASAGNPTERERVLKGIVWTGIGTAGCGSATLIFSLFFRLFG